MVTTKQIENIGQDKMKNENKGSYWVTLDVNNLNNGTINS